MKQDSFTPLQTRDKCMLHYNNNIPNCPISKENFTLKSGDWSRLIIVSPENIILLVSYKCPMVEGKTDQTYGWECIWDKNKQRGNINDI